MFNLKAKALVTGKDYKKQIIQIQGWCLEAIIQNYKVAVNKAYQALGKVFNEDGYQHVHREYLPEYIEALRVKYVELYREKGRNRQINMALKEIEKLFDQYKQRLNVKMGGEVPGQPIGLEKDEDSEILKGGVKGIDLASPDPKYLCCLQFALEGKLNVQNLEHDFISIPMGQGADSYLHAEGKSQKQSRSSLEDAICAALNYPRDVIIVLGMSRSLEVVGIPFTQDLQKQYQKQLLRIFEQSIKPNFLLSNLNMKIVPILKRKGLKETGKCLITIEARQRTSSLYFIQVERDGYFTKRFLIAKKQYKSLRQSEEKQREKTHLKVEELKGEQIDMKIIKNREKISINRRIHYFQNGCKDARPLNYIKKNNSPQLFQDISKFANQKLSQICRESWKYKNFTYMKFESQKGEFQFECEELIQNINRELQSQRENYRITRLKWQISQNHKIEKCPQTVFFVIIMHDYPETMKKTISSFEIGINFEFGPVTSIHKLYDIRSNNQLHELKKKDRNLYLQFKPEFDIKAMDRFLTMDSENIRKVYYEIKDDCKISPPGAPVASLRLFIINAMLGMSPQFVEGPVAEQRHYLPVQTQIPL